MPVGETEEGEELEPMDKGEFKKAVLELMSVSAVGRHMLMVC
jgi:hypothetical protein